MLNVNDSVRIVALDDPPYPQVVSEIGIIIAVISTDDDTMPIYNVRINNRLYDFYSDEIEVVKD